MEDVRKYLTKHQADDFLDPLLELGVLTLEDLKWLDLSDLEEPEDPETVGRLQRVFEEVKIRFRDHSTKNLIVNQAYQIEPLFLLELAKAGNVVELRKTLKRGFVNVDEEEEGSGVTALCVAADSGKQAVSRTLISCGANVNHV